MMHQLAKRLSVGSVNAHQEQTVPPSTFRKSYWIYTDNTEVFVELMRSTNREYTI